VIRRRVAVPAAAIAAVLGVILALVAYRSARDTTEAGAPTGSRAVTIRAEVTATIDRDPGVFTQGLELDGDVRYESGGRYGESAVYAVDRRTGAVLRTFRFPPQYFAEGLTKVGPNLIVLTWQEQTAFVLDAATFAERGRIAYQGEGWGICALGDEVVTSDGTDVLTFRDPATFAVRRTVAVRLDGAPVRELNELECTGNVVYANVWQTDRILRIVPGRGVVDGVLDLPDLRPVTTRSDPEAVLNGIAVDPKTGRVLVTGKRWPSLFELRLTSS
jgi:glutamine cyclotransferase